MGFIHARTTCAIGLALLLACLAACTPAIGPQDTPTAKGLVVDQVNFSPPEPFDGNTYIDIIGTLPDGCTEIDDIDHTYTYGNTTVDITITTSRPEGVACTQVATPFRKTIRVRTGNLYPGTYTVIVNGESFSFPWDMEFIIPLTPDPGS